MKRVLKAVLIALALLLCLFIGVGLRRIFVPSDKAAVQSQPIVRPEVEYDSKKPGAAVARNQAALIYRNGQKFLYSGNYTGAIAQFTEALKLRPGYENAYLSRAYARADLHDFAGAVEDLSSVIKLDPDNSMAYAVRGQFRNSAGDPKNALLDYDTAIDIEPNSDQIYCGRADILYSLGDVQSAAADYNAALKINPRSTKAYTGLSKCTAAAR